MKYIDIHSHLAWDLDDGIETLEDCQKLLSQASKDHIIGIVATPHFVCGKHTKEDFEQFEARINELKALAKEFSIEVFRGSELFINDLLFQQIETRSIVPIENTNYVLCEFNVRRSYDEDCDLIYDALYELILAGYKPILAHVERYFDERIDLSFIQTLVDIGCVLQVNTSSILHPSNSVVKKNVTDLLDNNLIHVIATDSHRHTGRRSPNMNEAFSYLSKNYDSSDLKLLFYQNPLAIVSNQPVSVTQFKKRKFGIRRFF